MYPESYGKGAVLFMLLMRSINILANYKADLCYREGIIYKYKSSKVVC